MPHGEYGIIVDAKVFTRENGDELSPGVNQAVRIYIAQKRKISVGDKMAGRHGNKGVVSRVLPAEDMPYLPNGRPLDIVLNPLGVPSRMNIGQVLEIHLSLAAKALGFNISTPVFDGANEIDIMDTLDLANDYVNLEWEEFAAKHGEELLPEVLEYLSDNREHRKLWKGVPLTRDGKVRLRDGRTGEFFDSPVTIGHMHYLKLHHLVDDKIQGIHNVDLVRPVEYRCGNIESQRLSGKAQMNFKYLSDVHTGRHTQRIQHDIQRPSVRQVRHILCRQHTGNNTLVTMTSGHLIPNGNLSLLGDIDTYCLINARRQFIAIFSCKYFGIHDDTIFTMRHLQGSVSYFAGFLTENRTQQSLFCCQFCLSLWSYLADQNIPCTHLRTNTDDSPLIQIFQRVIADTRNIFL